MNGEPIQILLLEDNPGDVRLTREAFKDGKVANTIHVVEDGEQALAYLRKQGKYADAVRPDIILLDLNLPKKDGREGLREIKSDQGLKQIPVVVLTTSASEEAQGLFSKSRNTPARRAETTQPGSRSR